MLGEGNSVLFINRNILPGPEDARICFTFFKDNEEFQRNSKKYSIDNEFVLNTAVCLYSFYFLEIRNHHGLERIINSSLRESFPNNVNIIIHFTLNLHLTVSFFITTICPVRLFAVVPLYLHV